MFIKYNEQGDILGFTKIGWQEGQDTDGNYVKYYDCSSVNLHEDRVIFIDDGDYLGSILVSRKPDSEINELKLDNKKALLRPERNKRLAESDIEVLKFIEKGQTVPSQWTAYRDKLRDLTDTVTVDAEVTWPDKPEDN